MTAPPPAVSWQDLRRLLASRSKNALLNLLRDLYALHPDNQTMIRTQVLTPKPTRPKDRPRRKEPSGAAKVLPKIRQLARIARGLRGGASFNITRLTLLKGLCEDTTAAARFALHLARLTSRKMQEHPRRSHLDPEQWEYYKHVVDEAVRQMARYVEAPTEDAAALVRAWLPDVRAIQDTYRHQAWGPVRIIQSVDVLLIEYALACVLQPAASADWGYRLGRHYAERYNSRNGTGRIPESAPLVEDLAEFWSQYHLGKPLHEGLGEA
jgi:hypothetical protein